jgi:hypothetical protein
VTVVSEKYVVFKVAEWDEFILKVDHGLRHGDQEPDGVLTLLPEPVPDAEVFRHQDLVAAPIFYNASSIYQSYLELSRATMTDAQQEYMREVIDHFFEAAEKSTGLPQRKLPD